MAVPVVTLTPNKSSYLPGEAITVQVTATDPDNATERLVLSGRDSQNNVVSVTLDVNRIDPFTVESAVWERTAEPLTVNGLTVTGTVPSA